MAKKQIRPEEVIRSYTKDLKNKIKIEKVILFGSAALGKMTKDSDIDLIILSKDFKKIDFLKRLELLSNAREKKAEIVPMDILGYTPEEFEELSKESIVLGEAKRYGRVVPL